MYLPEAVKYIIKVLEKNGYEAYAVGGCVRDSILGRNPDDWDITTSAKPEQTKELFDKTFDTGIEHGTITVLVDNIGYEVTTYRIDGEYEDSRRPSDVEFTTNLREDLLRRDFTINAMAYNEKDGLVDIFGGIEDLEFKNIRCVGTAKDRFTEDALRILRAIRFSAQLGFEIEEETQAAIKELAPTLANISAERIQVEMVKLLTSPNPQYLNNAYELGVTAIILPEWDKMMKTEQETPCHRFNVGEHTLSCLGYIRNDKVSRLLALFHAVAKPDCKSVECDGITDFAGYDEVGAIMAKSIMKRWKLDNHTISRVTKLVACHKMSIKPELPDVRKAMNKIGVELFPTYLDMQYADIMSRSDYKRVEKVQNLKDIKEVCEVIKCEGHAIVLKDLAIDGASLIQLGVPQGKQIGEILHKMLDLVLDDHTKNKREVLLEEVKKYI